jgi:ferredoxin-thioredoxin reductase catalytic subunit
MKIIINSDKELVKDVREGLWRTGGFCPCRVAQTEDTRCMCKDFREQSTEGECYCGLFIKVKD